MNGRRDGDSPAMPHMESVSATCALARRNSRRADRDPASLEAGDCATPAKTKCHYLHPQRAIALAISLLLAQQAAAQSVPNGTNLSTLAAPTSSTVWSLLGDALLYQSPSASFKLTLPGGTPGLTINGVAGGSTVTLNDGAGHAGYFGSSAATTLNLSNIAFTGGKETSGAVINSGGALTLNTSGTVAFNSNSATNGAIYAAGTITVNGSIVANGNTSVVSGSKGAAIYSGANVVVTGSTSMSSNSVAQDGGAIYAVGGVNLAGIAGDVTLTNNSAVGNGGSIFASASGTNSTSIGNSVGFVVMTGNKAGFNSAGVGQNTTSYGSAIYSMAPVILAGGVNTVSGNTATGGAGGIYSAQSVTVDGDLTANSNVAQNFAGGVINSSTGLVSVAGSLTANNNMAAKTSGGVFASGSVAIGNGLTTNSNSAGTTGGVFSTTGNVTIGGSASMQGNKAGFNSAGVALNTTSYGGAIYSLGTVTLAGSVNTVSGNTATGGAGGIYSAQSVTIAGDLTANSNVAQNFSGGAINSNAGLISVGGNLTANGNIAAKAAGGVIASGSVSIGNSLIANNNTAGTTGGAIYTTGKVTVGDGVSMNGNVANAGAGGAIQASNGYVALATANGDVSLTNNIASASGGAIYATGSGNPISIGNSGGTVTISGNLAGFNSAGVALNITSLGGAIDSSQGPVALTGSAIALSSNSATASGGGIYSAQAVSVTGDLTANGNQALNGNGGAIYSQAGNVSVTGSLTGNGNRALTAGGAIFTNAGSVAVTGGVSMDANIAAAGTGGAVRVTGGNVNLATTSGNVSLTNNIAFANGGALFAAGSGSGNVSIGNAGGTVTLTGNKAGFNANGSIGGAATAGGAINANTGATTLTGSTIILSSNASNGTSGGIFSAQAVMVNGDLTANGNQALSGTAGAIRAVTGDVTVTGATSMDSNIAGGGMAGAIYAANGNVNLSTAGGDVSLTNNIASSHGGAVTASGVGNISVGNGSGAITISGNKAGFGSSGSQVNTASNGGGLYGTGTVTMADSAATVSGNNASANGGGIFSAQDVTVTGALTANGNAALNGDGGALYAGATATITRGAVTLQNNTAAGGNGGGVRAGSDITLSAGGASTISGNTASGQGGALWSGGDVSLAATGGNVAFTGNSAGGLGGAIYLDPTALTLSAIGGDISFSGNMQNTASTPQANAIYIANLSGATSVLLDAEAGHTISFFDPIQNDGTQGLITVTKTGDGLVSFDGSNFPTVTDVVDRWSKIYANTEVQAGTFEVANAAAYGDRAADVGDTVHTSTFTVDSGATLQGGVFGAVLADQVTFQDGATLNLAGRQPNVRSVFGIDAANITFVPGSQILFNTELNDGSVQNSDRLVLSRGMVNGTAQIMVNNIGGAGALTVGDGIQLVATINGATTTPDSFVLGERVAAGAYEYNLVRGSPTNGDDWFLKNTFVPPEPPPPPVPPVPPAPPPQPPPPAPPPGPPSPPAPPGPPDPPVPPAPPYPPSPPGPPEPVLPDYRVEVPVDAAVPLLASQLGLAMLGNYHDRVGEDDASQWQGAQGSADNTGWQPGSSWGRIFGSDSSVGYGSGDVVDHYNHFLSDGPSYNSSLYGFQTGLDLYRAVDEGQRDSAGFSFGADRSNSDVRGIYDGTEAGEVSMDGFTLGGYWTRKGASGWYVDTVLQATRYENIHARSIYGQDLSSAGWGVAASIEGGHPYALSDSWSLEPQGQLIYQRVSLDDGHDDYGDIQYNGSTALYGRLGLRLVHGWRLESGRALTAWARVNVWDVMGPDPKTTFTGLDGLDPLTFQSNLGGHWAQAQLGLSGVVSSKLSLFGSLDYDRTLGVGNGHALGGRVGVRLVW